VAENRVGVAYSYGANLYVRGESKSTSIFDSYFALSVKLHLSHKRTDGQTVTSGGNNLNDFPDNQVTKFRVFYWLVPDFNPPLPIKFQ